jgi:uncharacterized protein YbjT (DUF2867 family)
MKRILITGATGMVGSHLLDYCLESSEVSEVISLQRRTNDRTHTKLKEVVVSDFNDLSGHVEHFRNIDTAHFCMGVYTGQVPDHVFKVITVDYAVTFGKMLKGQSPDAVLCLLSGQGADRSEKSRMSFAKYKGMAENQLSELELGGFHTFRPAYIYPVVPRKEPNFMYNLSRKLYPVIKLMGRNGSIKSTELAQGMFKVGLNGTDREELENAQILDVLAV